MNELIEYTIITYQVSMWNVVAKQVLPTSAEGFRLLDPSDIISTEKVLAPSFSSAFKYSQRIQ